MIIDESIADTILKVQELTGKTYNVTWTDAENLEGYIFDDALMVMVEDLIEVIENE